jgi:EmrB/QacA subfamily drug resistance transporter
MITEANRRWWVLIGACSALFVLMLDSTVVALALPSIQHDLDASAAELQWMQNAYLLVLSAFVVTAGRLGDIVGRKRVFMAGLVVFGAGCVVAALAPDPAVLVAGRAVMGFGAAPLLTLSLAIVSEAFDDAERPRALGIWAAVSALALGIGPVFGGALIELAAWPWIFWIDVPVLAVGLVISAVAIRESRDESAGSRIDWPGLATLALGLTAIVLALVQAQQWGAAPVAAAAAVGVLSLAAFVWIELRVESPIVEFDLFRNGPYFGATMAGCTLVGAYWVVIFYEPQLLQDILGHSAFMAGLMVLPIAVPMIFLSPVMAGVNKRLGTRRVMTAGMVVGVAGLAILALIPSDPGYGQLLAGYLLFGIALGIVYASMSTAAMQAMPRAKAGIASGVLGMSRVLSGALALAAVGAVFQSLLASRRDELTPSVDQGGPAAGTDLDSLLAGAPDAKARIAELSASAQAMVQDAAREAFTYALGRSLWITVAMVAAGATLTWIFVRSGDEPAPAPGEEHHLMHHRRFHL